MTRSLPVESSQFPLKPQSDKERWLVADIETNGLYENVTKVHCIVCKDIRTNEVFSYGPSQIDEALATLCSADYIIGHNFLFYDLPVLEKLHEIKLPGVIIDTLVMSRLIWPQEKMYDHDLEFYPQVELKLRGRHSLRAWGQRLSDHKGDYKDFSMFCQEMLEYCEQDVNVTHKLFDHCVSEAYPAPALSLEHEFAQAISKQIISGIPFDGGQARDLVDVLSRRQQDLETELHRAFPPERLSEWYTPRVNNSKRGYVKGVPVERVTEIKFNPGSRQQIVKRLQGKYNWQPDKFTEKGNPILDDDVLEKLPFPEAKLLAEYMLIKKRLGQIANGSNAWLKLVAGDGRMHGNVNTNGTITGRCSHSQPNLGQTVAAYSPYGKECRALFYAPAGWSLLGVDAKALELRCLAGYLAWWDQGAYGEVVVDPEQDIHIYNQLKFGVATRDISKRLLYAVLYGAGHLKAGQVINPECTNEDDQRTLGRTAISAFLNGLPALRLLKEQIEAAIRDRGHLIGLDKRVLYCRSAFKGLNVLLQSAGAILMKKVVCLVHERLEEAGFVYDRDWQQALMIHDEIQLLVKDEHVETIEQIVLECFPAAQEFYGFKCLIEGDAKAGITWADTH